jgi:broad specificity phosphatase PhoE
MGKLILVRHGESLGNRERFFAQDDTPLTDLGRSQALEVARKISDRFRPVAIVSSHLVRARQTAAIIAAELGLAFDVVPGLEECDFGVWKGRPYEGFLETIRHDPAFDAARPWAWAPEGGESSEQTGRRVIAALEQLRTVYPDDEILVVCHGMMMLALWAHLTGTWERVDVPPNCAVVIIEHAPGRFHSPVLVEDCLVAQEAAQE